MTRAEEAEAVIAALNKDLCQGGCCQTVAEMEKDGVNWFREREDRYRFWCEHCKVGFLGRLDGPYSYYIK